MNEHVTISHYKGAGREVLPEVEVEVEVSRSLGVAWTHPHAAQEVRVIAVHG
jgi:hypothetical protein